MKQAKTKDIQSIDPPINGVAVSFPGIAVSVDCPFGVSDRLPLIGGLEEAEAILHSAWQILSDAANRIGSAEIRGCAFLVQSGGALVTSLLRGAQQHPIALRGDGYHCTIDETVTSP